jgi:hypothetical protein
MNYPDHSLLLAAARSAARAIRPVTRVLDGSGRLEHTGTAFILGNQNERLVVTAEHVLKGPEAKRIGISESGSLSWPRNYRRLASTTGHGPDADIAFTFAEIEPSGDGTLSAAIPLESVTHSLTAIEGMSLLAVGFPSSKAKLRDAQTKLSTKLMYVVTLAEPDKAYETLELDQAVFIATRYDRKALRGLDGEEFVGADPHGMSGGVLFQPLLVSDIDGKQEVLLRVAGVLTRYFDDPQNTLVATRIDCLRDVVAPYRSPSSRLYYAGNA